MGHLFKSEKEFQDWIVEHYIKCRAFSVRGPCVTVQARHTPTKPALFSGLGFLICQMMRNDDQLARQRWR